MATEFKLDYTGSEINQKLGKIDGLSHEISFLSSEIVDIKSETLQQTPKFANSIAECTDTTIMYVLPDGYIYACTHNANAGVSEWTNTGHKFVAPSGKSAYEYALEAGYEGTEKEFADQMANPYASATTEDVFGNLISIVDAMNHKLQGLKLYGKTTQDGIPTMKTPVPLVSAGSDGIIVVRVMESVDDEAPQSLTFSTSNTSANLLVDNIDGAYTGNGKTYEIVPNMGIADGFLSNTQYTLSFDYTMSNIAQTATGNLLYFQVVYTDGTTDWVGITESTITPFVYMSKAEKTISRIAFTSHQRWTGGTITITNSQIEKGVVPTIFPTPSGIPGIPVSNGGNYTDENGQQWICDEVDFASGVYIQRIKTIVFDGSGDEKWTVEGPTGKGVYRIVNSQYNAIIKPTETSDISSNALCSSSPTVSGGVSWWSLRDMFAIDADARIMFVSPDFTSSDTLVTDWKSYLSTNPVTIVAELVTPIERALSAEELNIYSELHTYSPNTIITNTDDVGMEVSYAVDLKKHIDDNSSKIISLSSDVAQLRNDVENNKMASYNLFDIDNADIKQAAVTGNFVYDQWAKTIVFPCVAGKTYRISRKNSTKRFNVNFTSVYPDVNGTDLLQTTKYVHPYTHCVVTAPDNAKYMVIMFYHANYDADYNATLEEFMIHEGSEWKPYVPHLVSSLVDIQMSSEMRSIWRDRVQSTPMFTKIVQNWDSQCTIADGHILYSGSWSANGGIVNKYDVSIECSPKLLATISISPRHQVGGIAQNDRYLYVVTRENKSGEQTWEDSTYGGSLVIIDKQTFNIVNTIQYPKNPYTENDYTAYFGKAAGLAIYENLMAVNLQLEGWILYDITDNTNPVQLHKLDVRSTWHSSMPKLEYQRGQFFKANDNLYYAVCGYEDGMYVYDLSDTSSPAQVAFFDMKNTCYNPEAMETHTFGLYVDYPYAYITIAPSHNYYFHEYRRLGIATIDMSDFNNLTFTVSLIDECDRPDDYRALDSCPNSVVKIGNKLAINIDSSGIGVFTIDNPAKPVYRGKIDTGTRINGLYATDDGRLIATPQYDSTRKGCIYVFRGV